MGPLCFNLALSQVEALREVQEQTAEIHWQAQSVVYGIRYIQYIYIYMVYNL